MDAAVLTKAGEPRFSTFTEPRAGDGGVVVDVRVAGLNPVDVIIAAGTHFGVKPDFPCITGREGVGEVGGRRVYFGTTVAPFGSMAQRTLVAPEELFDVPDGLDDGVAVALGIAGSAAWLPLAWRANLQPGERVLVLGATGVLGNIAVQAAKLLGAGRVIAAGRDPDGLRRACRRGADAGVDLRATDDLSGAFRKTAGGGVDVIIDALWGEASVAALGAAAPFARLVQIGNAAASTVAVSAPMLRETSTAVLGYTNRMVPLADRAAAYAALAEHAAAGRILVDVERIPLRDVELAWHRQTASSHRKIVIVP